jgi:outer membrane protein assembly factor BamB
VARDKVTDATPETTDDADPADKEPAQEQPKDKAKPAAAKAKSTAKKATAKKASGAKASGAKPTAKAGGAKATGAKTSGAKMTGAKATEAKTSGANTTAKMSGAKAGEAKVTGAKTSADKAGGGKPGGTKRSGTAAAAALARTTMQRRHLRIGFAMTAALGAEVAGVAGLVVAGLRPWEWGEQLWGRDDRPAIVIQVAIALTVLAVALAWLVARSDRSYRWRVRLRVAALLPAAVALVGAVAMVWQADTGARDEGGVVAAVSAVLVLAGAVGWLVGLRRLRVLFPFGLADARATGYGNLPAVRRAQLIGGPAGAVGGIVVVAGALLVVPGWVATEDAQTASALALTGATPAADGEPAWEIELAAADESNATGVWASTGGLVIEEIHGARGVDPRTGEQRWHWRDDAYRRVAGALTADGATVVLALEYDGDIDGRDRVVGIDAATGELRWDRFDDSLVAAMTTIVIAPEDGSGNVFVAPEQAPPDPAADPATAQDPPVELLVAGSDDGEIRHRLTQDEGCRYVAANVDAPGVVVTGQQCFDEASATMGCLVSGVDLETGDARWAWPPEADRASVSDCQTVSTAELVFVSHQVIEDPDAEEPSTQPAAVALDPATGEVVWTAEPADDGSFPGLSNPVIVVGDAVLGTQTADDGTGGSSSTLVIRNTADGQVRDEVELPAGQPIGIVPVRDGVVAISYYRSEEMEVVVVEVDIASASVVAETPVASAPAENSVRQVSVSAGPETLVADVLLAAGAEPGAGDYTLLVRGW